MGKLNNGKAQVRMRSQEEMIKGRGNRVVHWIWRLCNMAFESGVEAEDWRPAVIVPLYKGKGERRECSNYRGIKCGWKNICSDPSRHRS